MTTWIILRAAGVGAYLMLFGSVAWGLVSTTSLFGKRVAKATAVAVHQFMSTVALVLLAVHLGGVLMDKFVPFRWVDLLVPAHSHFRPAAVAFGIIAMYSMVIVLVSSWARKHYSNKLWRGLHLFAAPAFVLSMVHGVFAGTDTVRPWMWWIYAGTGSIVLFLLLLRAFTAGVRPARAAAPAHARPARTTAASRPAHEEAPADPAPAPAPAAVPAAAQADRVAAARARAAEMRAARAGAGAGPPKPTPPAKPAPSDTARHLEIPVEIPGVSEPGQEPPVVRIELHVSIEKDGEVRILGARPAAERTHPTKPPAMKGSHLHPRPER